MWHVCLFLPFTAKPRERRFILTAGGNVLDTALGVGFALEDCGYQVGRLNQEIERIRFTKHSAPAVERLQAQKLELIDVVSRAFREVRA